LPQPREPTAQTKAMARAKFPPTKKCAEKIKKKFIATQFGALT